MSLISHFGDAKKWEVDLVQHAKPQPAPPESCRAVLLSAASAQKWPAGLSSTMVSAQGGPSSWGFPVKGSSLYNSWLGHEYSPFNGTCSAASSTHVAFCTVHSSWEPARRKSAVCTHTPSLSPLLICVYKYQNSRLSWPELLIPQAVASTATEGSRKCADPRGGKPRLTGCTQGTRTLQGHSLI